MIAWLEPFAKNCAVIGGGLAAGYVSLLLLFFRFDCWQLDVWEEARRKLVREIPEDCLYVSVSGARPAAIVKPAIDTGFVPVCKEVRWAHRVSQIGIGTIKLIKPGLAPVMALVMVSLAGGFAVTISEAPGSIVVNRLKAAGVLAMVPTAVTVVQFMLLTALQETAEEEEDGGLPLRSVVLSHLSYDNRPRHRQVFSRSSGYRTYLETNAQRSLDDPGELPLWMFVSIKNPRFSRGLVRYVVNDLAPQFDEFRVVLVDEPYLENIEQDFSGTELKREKNKLRTIKEERWTMIKDIVEDCGLEKDPERLLRRWGDLSINVNGRLRDDIQDALDDGDSRFRKDAVAEVSKSLDKAPAEAEDYLGFFRAELPVLVYVYYDLGPIADVYPGRNSPLIWNLENGEYADELPRATKLAVNNPVYYLQVEPFS